MVKSTFIHNNNSQQTRSENEILILHLWYQSKHLPLASYLIVEKLNFSPKIGNNARMSTPTPHSTRGPRQYNNTWKFCQRQTD